MHDNRTTHILLAILIALTLAIMMRPVNIDGANTANAQSKDLSAEREIATATRDVAKANADIASAIRELAASVDRAGNVISQSLSAAAAEQRAQNQASASAAEASE